MAVLKGQGWNIVQSLKRDVSVFLGVVEPLADPYSRKKVVFNGPLELTRRVKVLVWDDEVEVVNEAMDTDAGGAVPPPVNQSPKSPRSPVAPPTRQSISPLSFAIPRRRRSRSISDFPPPRPRAPVPFTQAIGSSSGETSGVAMLAQLEKLDKVSGGKDDATAQEEVEVTSTDIFGQDQALVKNVDVTPSRPGPSRISPVPEHDESETALPPPPHRIASDPVPVIQEDLDGEDDELNPMMFSSVTSLGDNTPIPPSMTRSATAAHGSRPSLDGRRWPSFGAVGKRGQRLSLDTATATDVVSGKTRTVIQERLQTVDSKAFFQNW
ncbi:unnamed protein product [Rhizoctonia solani]|uniref:Uncharacterized protein n=1 Tax=Rhizoctonia solani TaxID=456999 RepID=A0A8H2X886_9AGAM|nr:unnamed protein product [Rhizoctonia solani]